MVSRMLRLMLGCSLAGVVGSTAFGLTWENRAMEVTADSGQGDVRVEFRFRNDGSRPVVIRSVEPHCGCMMPVWEKRSYAPGDGGRILILFEVGDRTGLQREDITVTTDEAEGATTTLALRVRLPELMVGGRKPLAAAAPSTGGRPVPAVSRETTGAPVPGGGLRWDTQAIELTAELEDRQVMATYSFRNTAGRPITVLGIEPGCGCVRAVSDRKSYAPGETGRIVAIFTVGDRTGRQEEAIDVATDLPGEPPARLTLGVTIREYLSLEPRVATWDADSVPTERTIVCRALQGQRINVVAARSSHPVFTTRIEIVEPGRVYRVHLTPTSTHQPLSTVVELPVVVEGVGQRTFTTYAYIRMK